MGKIFGISDLPVSTIMSPFEQITIEKPSIHKIKDIKYVSKDTFVPQKAHTNYLKRLIRSIFIK